MTRALLASAVVMDAAGWLCIAQGAHLLARICFVAALPFIAAWVVGSLRDRRRARSRRATGSAPPPIRGAPGAKGPDSRQPAHKVSAADMAGRRHRTRWRGSALRLHLSVRPSGKGMALLI